MAYFIMAENFLNLVKIIKSHIYTFTNLKQYKKHIKAYRNEITTNHWYKKYWNKLEKIKYM